MSGGGEILNLGQPQGVKWANGDDFTEDFYMTIPTISKRVSKTFASRKTLMNRMLRYMGKVNSQEFRDVPAGYALFGGCDSEEFYNEDNEKRWKAIVTIEVRKFKWNEIFDPATATWRLTDPLTYSSIDFAGFFAKENAEGA